jgi:hypothetical protein
MIDGLAKSLFIIIASCPRWLKKVVNAYACNKPP